MNIDWNLSKAPLIKISVWYSLVASLVETATIADEFNSAVAVIIIFGISALLNFFIGWGILLLTAFLNETNNRIIEIGLFYILMFISFLLQSFATNNFEFSEIASASIIFALILTSIRMLLTHLDQHKNGEPNVS